MALVYPVKYNPCPGVSLLSYVRRKTKLLLFSRREWVHVDHLRRATLTCRERPEQNLALLFL